MHSALKRLMPFASMYHGGSQDGFGADAGFAVAA
jgi:hypothetical protein